MTLTDAITSAGGFTEFAGRSKIKVLHKDHSVAGRYDYERILKHKSADPVLEPGDIISVIGSLD
jgi:protein involved in polysaccharide export with SLBB domain